jgi:dihydrofolate reductase
VRKGNQAHLVEVVTIEAVETLSPDEKRPRCSVFIATSLDGCIARKDGGLDFLRVVERPDEDYGYSAFFASIDTMIIGRGTYEAALAFPSWPYAGKRCVVLTHSTHAPRHGEELHAGELGPLLSRLHAEGAKRAYVDGGAVIRSFLAEGLIDELTLSIVPVLVGDGIPLFGPGSREHRLEWRETRAFPSGLVQMRYGSSPA